MLKAPTTARISLPLGEIEDFCRRWKVSRLALFGSVLRADFRADSDVDVLIRFTEGYVPGLEFFRMQNELSAILGRTVDLRTEKDLSPFFSAEVLSLAQPLYVAA